ncbi:hypothetical protein Tco_0500076 [Tanacetum coccineum]
MGASFADISLDKGSGSGSAPAADVKVEQGNSNKPDPPASASEMNIPHVNLLGHKGINFLPVGFESLTSPFWKVDILTAGSPLWLTRMWVHSNVGGEDLLRIEKDDVSLDEESEGNNEEHRGSDNEHVSEMSFAHENVDEFQVNPKPSCFTSNVEENVVDNIPGNTSQPKPNPTTSGNKEKTSSVNDKFQASGSILEVLGSLHLPNFCYIMSMLSHDLNPKEELWDFIHHLIDSWDGECVLLGKSLKSSIKHWLAEDNQKSNEHKRNIQNRLIILDKIFDQGSCNDDLIHERSNLLKELQDFNKSSSLDMAQKAKIRWAIEGE